MKTCLLKPEITDLRVLWNLRDLGCSPGLATHQLCDLW